MHNNIQDLTDKFTSKIDETKELIKAQMPEPKVDAIGVSAPPAYPEWLSIARMKLIKKIVIIGEQVQTASFQGIEKFILRLSQGEKDVEKAWIESMDTISKVNTAINLQEIFEANPATSVPTPKLCAFGTVTRKITDS